MTADAGWRGGEGGVSGETGDESGGVPIGSVLSASLWRDVQRDDIVPCFRLPQLGLDGLQWRRVR